MILSLDGVSFKYVTDKILDNASFIVNEKDKWGIVGLNGSGKSTLLKIMAEVEKPDSGELSILRKYRISYCPQEMAFKSGLSVYETVASYMKEETEIYQIKSILNRLGIEDHNQMIDVLSGGQKKRVALAIALIRTADLYLLDEPTNHLDQDMIVWLEKFLSKTNAAIVMVTHDRYFLSRVTDHIVEIDKGKLYCYEGNYSDYLEKRELRYEMERAMEQKRQNYLRNEIEWIRRGAQARTTKQKSRIERYERIAAIEAPKEKDTLQLKSASSRLGKKIIEIHDISKSFGDKLLFEHFSYNLLRDDRIGIIGGNGCGKTTFLRMLLGELEPDNGFVDVGETVKIGYFAQNNAAMDEDKRVIDYLKDFGEVIYTSDGEAITASQMLERFLFPKDKQYLPIGKCSGGEKRRLYLCSILMGAPNVLLLDEPTNDLDTDTLSILEEYLEDFKGAVISVSHDRYFVDKTCNHLFVFGNGSISLINDDYSTYLENKKDDKETVIKEATVAVRAKTRKGLSYKEKIEYEELEKLLNVLENEIAEMENALGSLTDYQEVAKVSAKLDEKRNELDEKTERYLELMAKEEG